MFGQPQTGDAYGDDSIMPTASLGRALPTGAIVPARTRFDVGTRLVPHSAAASRRGLRGKREHVGLELAGSEGEVSFFPPNRAGAEAR